MKYFNAIQHVFLKIKDTKHVFLKINIFCFAILALHFKLFRPAVAPGCCGAAVESMANSVWVDHTRLFPRKMD